MSKYPGNIVTTGADAAYSVYFDGTGDYLNTPSSASFSFGTGNFTIEYWVYPISGANNGMFQVSAQVGGLNATAANSVACNIFTTNSITVYANNFTYSTSSNKLPFGTWTHLAIVRSSGVTRLYINGVMETSIGTGGAITDPTNYTGTYFAVGGYYSTSYLWNGYISNFRVIKGTALYTANFTPPTQLFNITNTSLLTCNSPAIVDQGTANSGSGFTITANGNAAVSTFTPFAGYQAYNPALGAATPGIWTVSDALQAAANRSWNMYDPYFNYTTLKLSGTPVTNVPTWITDASTNNFAVTPVADARAANFSPFSSTTYPNSGSGYFDGTGDYLEVASNAAFGYGTGDFTIEFWAYLTSISASIPGLFDQRNGVVTQLVPTIYVQNGTLKYYTNGADRITGSVLSANTWYHIALSRAGTNTRLFVNGSQVGSTYSDSNNYINSPIRIFSLFDTSPVAQVGYCSNVRVVKGVAVYTGNFTTPTAPLTATQPAGTNIAAITGTSTSLLTLQNSQSSNNNFFLDSSSNNFLITRSGNTTQGTFTPFSQTGWSNFFTGTTSAITVSNAALAIGTSSFTVEAWVNVSSLATGSVITSSRVTLGAGVLYWNFSIDTTGQLLFQSRNSAGTQFYAQSSTGAITVGQWYHVVATRTSTGLMTVYVNGVAGPTTANDSSNNLTEAAVAIGLFNYTGFVASFSGYISNFRLVKGAVLYTGNFTPPTQPLAIASSGTTLLLTCQSNRVIDNGNGNSGSGFALTSGASTNVQAFSPFQTNVAYTPATIGGSGYFDGNGDYLSCASTNVFNFGTSAYTIEFWLYNDSSGTGYQPVINASGVFAIYTRTNQAQLWNGPNPVYVSSASLVPNTWNHVAIVRTSTASNGTVWYINGVASTAGTDATNWGANSFTVAFDTTPRYLTGYLSGFRVVKSQALTTGAFTPPTVPVTASSVGWTGANVAASLTGSVAFLLSFTNAGITDTTGKNVLETVNDARIVTAVSKYGGSSMYFDGTGDRLKIPYNPNLLFYSGDFTVEMWLYKLANNAYMTACGNLSTPASAAWSMIGDSTGNKITWYSNSAFVLESTTLLATSTWYHVAIARSGTTIRLFINGTQEASATNSTNYNVTNDVIIGQDNQLLGGRDWNGYIQDFRITRGFARYTGNFTPPTSLLQNQ